MTNDLSNSDPSAEYQHYLTGFTEKRPATDDEITAFKERRNVNFKAKPSCSGLDSDAGCSSESTPEFLYYTNNCVSYPIATSGLFNITTINSAITYYVDGDGDVNCDQYEDDLQSMIDTVIASTGPVYDIFASVYLVSSCRERSYANYIVFELEILLP